MEDRQTIVRYLRKLVLQFLVIGALSYAVLLLLIPQYYFAILPWVLLYFFLLNLISFYLLIKTHNLSTAKFYKYFMLMSVSKLFSSLVFVVVYLIFNREQPIPFLVIFIILYLHSLFQLVREFQRFLLQKKS